MAKFKVGDWVRCSRKGEYDEQSWDFNFVGQIYRINDTGYHVTNAPEIVSGGFKLLIWEEEMKPWPPNRWLGLPKSFCIECGYDTPHFCGRRDCPQRVTHD